MVLIKAYIAIAEPPAAAIRPPAKRKADEVPTVLARRKSCPAVPPKLECISEASAKVFGYFLVVYGQVMR